MISLILCVCFLVLSLMLGAFIIAYFKRDNTVADTAWGLGFILVAWSSLIQAGHYQSLGLVATGLVTLWGLRLITHINLRNRGKGEDPRYKNMRTRWGASAALQSFFKVFFLQGILLLIIAYQIVVINANPNAPLSLLSYLGIVIWGIGFFFESIGDYQLYAFMKTEANKGKVMMSGLWRYTRHPNYFGEIMMWWGIYLCACLSPYGLSALISPLTITYLLLFVSGVPLTEKMFAGNPEFELYKQKTSVLIPWFPKK